ncbi:hypothetical protein ScalyP_jg6599 [Parmales sp. scaly parma]|nr:hypothetical protein ScalyP_jg6599 [Parmales sp. scaly parma]
MSDNLTSSPKRERKQTDVLKPAEEPTTTSEWKVPPGPGVPLSEMENVMASIAKENFKKGRLTSLHFILFARKGKQTQVRKNLRLFSGFDDTVDLQKVKNRAAKENTKSLKELMDILGVSRTSKTTKEDLVAAFVDWAASPTLSATKRKSSSTPKPAKKAKKKQKMADDDDGLEDWVVEFIESVDMETTSVNDIFKAAESVYGSLEGRKEELKDYVKAAVRNL